jgi:hypothetical protein
MKTIIEDGDDVVEVIGQKMSILRAVVETTSELLNSHEGGAHRTGSGLFHAYWELDRAISQVFHEGPDKGGAIHLKEIRAIQMKNEALYKQMEEKMAA